MRSLDVVRNVARASLAVLLLLAALALIVFGPRSTAQTPSDRTVITYWEKWTDFEAAAVRDLVDLFNETVGRERRIFVEYVTTTGVDLKTLIAVSGGDPPDLAGLWQRNLHSFAATGALLPLGKYVSQSELDPNTIVPVFEHGCRYHGDLYALPLTPASIALYYNKSVFADFAPALRAAGLDPERPPRTIAELDAYADVIYRRHPTGAIDVLAYLPGSPDTVDWFWDTWPVWFGAKLFDPMRNELRVDGDACVQAYTWVRDFARRLGSRELIRFESSLSNYNSADNPFFTGRLAMVRQGPWFANTIRTLAPDLSYDVAAFPTADGKPTAFCEQDILVIPHGARHPDQAWTFIEWLYTADPFPMPAWTDARQPMDQTAAVGATHDKPSYPQLRLRPIEWLCWKHCKNSPLLAPSPGFQDTHSNPAIAVHDRLARADSAVMVPPLPNWAELRGEFAAAYRDIWLTDVPVAGRLAECQDRLSKMTAAAKKRLQRYGIEYP
ncbi:MAG: extracellular solute-binding protein [bacterium]|nr:extracellular solute-binding protein [bacterium]